MFGIEEAFSEAIYFLTNPDGLGFPILIGSGLGMVLYLMNKTAKEQKKADQKIEEKKDNYSHTIYPHKPF